MTLEQIDGAIAQCISHCRLLEETDYHSVSLRSVLYKLGFTEIEADEVIVDVAARGFDYCIDSIILHGDGQRCPGFATYWGPDQLRSRLNSIRSR